MSGIVFKSRAMFRKPVFKYLNFVKVKPPDKKLRIIYDDILAKWHYEQDRIGNDQIRNCNEIIKSKKFIGDCEDFSVLLMSFCRSFGINAVFCLGKNKERKSGHIWIEVEICRESEFDNETKEMLNESFDSNIGFSKRDGLVWLIFNFFEVVDYYDLEFIVDSNGKLIKC